MFLRLSRAASLAAFLTSAAAILSPPPAYAENATSEGAKALAQSLTPYLGQSAFERGLIAVTPKGDAYELKFDLQSVVEGFGLPKGTVQIDAYSLVAAPLPDGNWKVSSEGFPNIAFKYPTPQGDLAGSLSSSGHTFEGVYDPKLGAFLSFTQKLAAFEFKFREPNSDFVASFTGIDAQLKGTGNADGSASGKMRETFQHMQESVSAKPVTVQSGIHPPPTAVSYDIGPITFDASFDSLRTKELRDLLAFFIAHQGQEEIVAHQDELKDKILSAFPLFKSNNASVKLENVALGSPQGRIGIKSIVQSLHQTGLAPKAEIEIGFTIDGLSMPSGLIPAWATALVPTAIDVDVKLQVNDLDRIAHAAVANIDLRPNQSSDPAKLAPVMAMAMSSEPKLTLATGHMSAPAVELYYHGDMALLPQPTGTLTIEAEGLDKALAHLQDAAKSEPELQKSVLGLTMAKGLAKPGAKGRSVWVISYGADGMLSVNGQKMGSPVKR